MKRLIDLNGTNETWDINKTERKEHVEDACSLTSSQKNTCEEGISDLPNCIFLHDTSIYSGTPLFIKLWFMCGSRFWTLLDGWSNLAEASTRTDKLRSRVLQGLWRSFSGWTAWQHQIGIEVWLMCFNLARRKTRANAKLVREVQLCRRANQKVTGFEMTRTPW